MIVIAIATVTAATLSRHCHATPLSSLLATTMPATTTPRSLIHHAFFFIAIARPRLIAVFSRQRMSNAACRHAFRCHVFRFSLSRHAYAHAHAVIFHTVAKRCQHSHT